MGAFKDMGALLKVFFGAISSQLAGATAVVKTAGVDKTVFDSGIFPMFYSTTLTAAETLNFTVVLQESDDDVDGNYTAVATLLDDVLIATGVGTFTGEYRFKYNLAPLKKYVRLVITPTLSKADTDTVLFAAGLVGGYANTNGITQV